MQNLVAKRVIRAESGAINFTTNLIIIYDV